ncbi:BLUF domain-containing protein [Brevundimonas sp.]|uniref:BLUF domain-containing protein n=1 Tax=Brevundimonas sp. TaxID=1871086 RepID=UPI00286D2E39|nr:BLUF domain-containing protein [Brevundimonas sp.]
MPHLERLLYASTATGRTDSLLNMATILAESQRNNARDGLTGTLAAHDGRFIQVVEGTTSALDALLRRLAPDPRHRDIVVLDRRPITERRFTEWTMASSRLGPETAPVLERLMATPDTSAAEIVALLHEALEIGQSRAA